MNPESSILTWVFIVLSTLVGEKCFLFLKLANPEEDDGSFDPWTGSVIWLKDFLEMVGSLVAFPYTIFGS